MNQSKTIISYQRERSVERTESKEKTVDGNKRGNMEQSYSKASGKKIIIVDAEELRMVKEGLRQVSSTSSYLEKYGTKTIKETNHDEEKKLSREMYGSTMHKEKSPIMHSSIKQLNGSPLEMLVRDPPQEEEWRTVSKGKGSKQKDDIQKEGLEEIKDFQIPLSTLRNEVLAESVEEMEMMISSEGINHEDDDIEAKEEDYDSQVEKMFCGKTKNKTKEKEGKQNKGKGGRGRGRKPKK